MRVALFFTLFAMATVSVSAQWRLLPGSDNTNGWIVTNNATATTGDKNPAWNTNASSTLTFSLETNQGATHPLGFANGTTIALGANDNSLSVVGATGDAGCSPGTGTGLNGFFQTTPGTPCIVTVAAPPAGATWQYRCGNHIGMRGSIISAAAAGDASSSSSSTGAAAAGSSSSSSSATTPVVSSSSSAGTTTAPPKTNGTASVTMPALTVVLATITAAAIVA